MLNKPTVIWSIEAQQDLRKIHNFYCSQSETYANKTVNQLFSALDNILYAEQYQKDEILGDPFRRLFVNHVKVVYEVSGKTLTIYRLFDTRKG